MKITMDKQFTSLEMAKDVKAAMKEFKGMYTDGDVRNALFNYFGDQDRWDVCDVLSGDIIQCELSAAPKNFTWWDGIQYAVEIVIRNWDGFTFCRFYIDQNLKIDCPADLITIRNYRESVKILA